MPVVLHITRVFSIMYSKTLLRNEDHISKAAALYQSNWIKKIVFWLSSSLVPSSQVMWEPQKYWRSTHIAVTLHTYIWLRQSITNSTFVLCPPLCPFTNICCPASLDVCIRHCLILETLASSIETKRNLLLDQRNLGWNFFS